MAKVESEEALGAVMASSDSTLAILRTRPSAAGELCSPATPPRFTWATCPTWC